MSVMRRLPPRPSLEFDRKQAKSLLRQLRAGNPEALARALAQHPTIDATNYARIALADAQLVIAREYGFTSWPRLAQYMRDAERLQYSAHSVHGVDFQVNSVQYFLEGHKNRHLSVGRSLAAFVPRFYGMRVENAFDATITEDEARLAVARENSCSSWEVLLERAASERRERSSEWTIEPLQRAGKAMEARDLQSLQQIVAEHPTLLHPSISDVDRYGTLLSGAMDWERVHGREAMRPIVEWLASHGLELQREINMRLRGRMHMKIEDVQYLLERGADPNWIAPNGVPILEHALLNYWNGEIVDLIAVHTVPRKALWIAAGLGDVNGVRSFLDRDGKPTPAARQHRPPFDVSLFFGGIPTLPAPDDEEILLEAFWVAVLNSRTQVLEYMAGRGFNVNCALWGAPVVNMAVGNCWLPGVECLVRLGANLDISEGNSNGTARDLARTMWVNGSHGQKYRRVVELCGMDPDAILAEADTKRVQPPTIDSSLQQALDLADDDAFRMRQSDVRPENLLFGLCRAGGSPLLFFVQTSGMDRKRFHADVLERVRHAKARIEHPPLAMNAESDAMLHRAREIAVELHRDQASGLHLLSALVSDEHGFAAELLTRYAGNRVKLIEELKRV